MSALNVKRIPGSDPDLSDALVGTRLPTDEIEDGGRSLFRIFSEDYRAGGFAGLETCEGDQLLRSVVVPPGLRASGFGRSEGGAALAFVEPGSDILLATTSASSFFAHLGFIEVQRETLPAAVLSTRQLSSICPSSATIMKLIRPPT